MTGLPVAAPEAVHRLVNDLDGASSVELESGEGPFGVWLLGLGKVVLEIRREYHSWSLFLRSNVSGVSPVAFWRVALANGEEPAEPDLDADVRFLLVHEAEVSAPVSDL